jgi:hypothetical protein
MPSEVAQLLLRRSPLDRCPACGTEPFKPFMRGQVQRSKFTWWGLGGPRPYCSVICSECKEIVAHEDPSYPARPELVRKYRRRGGNP